MAQTAGKYDHESKTWIIKAVAKGGTIVIAAASSLSMAIELIKKLL